MIALEKMIPSAVRARSGSCVCYIIPHGGARETHRGAQLRVTCLVLVAAVLVSAFLHVGFRSEFEAPERTQGPGLALTEQIYRR